MIAAKSQILKSDGTPFERKPRFSEVDLIDFRAKAKPQRDINASYDAARSSDEMDNYWANSDAYDADSANSVGVRRTLMQRSRYEVGNNGFADGMVQTHANYVVGTGPRLRMQIPGNRVLNRQIEKDWNKWATAVQLRRKLWCMCHAKVQDGEAFGMVRNNPAMGPIGLDVVLIEAEQCHTPYLPYGVVGYIDGIRFDEFGNPIFYDILKYHPGAQWQYLTPKADSIPAKYVLHWFMLRRPGQHRAVPEFRSTLNTGASARRFRESTLAAADTAAEFAGILKTQQTPDTGAAAVAPMSTLPTQKRMMVAMPAGYDFMQMRAEHPNATYSEFNRSQINEMGRPKHLPYGMAACDSASYNFASGKLDRQPYYLGCEVERNDGEILVMEKLFAHWWQRYVLVKNLPLKANDPESHVWDWPALPEGDEESVANARDTNLRNGTLSMRRAYADDGLDYDDEVEQMAADYGCTVDEMKALLRQTVFGSAKAQSPSPTRSQQMQPQPQPQMAGGFSG